MPEGSSEIQEGGSAATAYGMRLGFFLGFGIKRFRRHFAAGLFEQNFHFAFGLLQVFLAIARKLHAFFEQLHGVVERKVRAFELANDFFQARQGTFKIRFFRGVAFFFPGGGFNDATVFLFATIIAGIRPPTEAAF